MAPASKHRRPTGRDAVMSAVQDAAVALLAEQGPREVTVRKVAARAGVNHALIHRHFGTKDALIRAVVSEQSRRLGEQAAALPNPDAAALLALLREHRAYWRVLARLALDDPALLGGEELPAAAATLAMITGGADADDDVRAGAAVAAATALGWLVFGPHLAAVLKVADRKAFDARVGEAVRRAVPRRVRSTRGGRAGPAG
jgi:AcrR family transcriptional regulator